MIKHRRGLEYALPWLGLEKFIFILMLRIRAGVVDDRLEYLMKQVLVVPQRL
jgi:hypothetical protein